ncbi:PLD nuclease N-terminal domain-containing protein [Salinimicrobium catena]|uniref:PLD nuclease N-terminal domain-containing protein n=1 Tax=Salinimicrobium catena TaxID=390640 RepID=UPI00389A6F8F
MFLLFGFWIWCMLDILTSRYRGSEKLLSFLLVVFAPVIGTIIYLLLGRKAKMRKQTFRPFEKRTFSR